MPARARPISVRVPLGIALFDYAAQANDELNLKEGDKLEILNRDASGWWTGRLLDGRQGLFPGNYIKEVASGPGIAGRSNYVRVPKVPPPPPPKKKKNYLLIDAFLFIL